MTRPSGVTRRLPRMPGTFDRPPTMSLRMWARETRRAGPFWSVLCASGAARSAMTVVDCKLRPQPPGLSETGPDLDIADHGGSQMALVVGEDDGDARSGVDHAATKAAATSPPKRGRCHPADLDEVPSD